MQTGQAWIPTNMEMSDATMIDLDQQHRHVSGLSSEGLHQEIAAEAKSNGVHGVRHPV